MKKNFFLFVILSVMTFGLIHCNLGTETPSDDNDGTSSTATTVTLTGNLDTISEDFTPDSLDYAQNNASLSQAFKSTENSGDPCAEADDLFDCQPILLQLYLDMAHNLVDMVRGVIVEVGEALGEVPDGGSGSTTVEGDTIEYSKTSAVDFSILMSGSSGSIAYVDVGDDVYTIQMNLSNLAEAGTSGQVEIIVTYTDEDTWDVAFSLEGVDCDSNDVRAPERIRTKVSKDGALWTGKVMFYNGVWLHSNPTCSTEASDELAMAFYTDFVASDEAARASVYLMPRTKNSLADIADFGMDSIDEHFDVMENTSAYVNPFCNPPRTLDALWGDDCSDLDPTLGDYGSASDWIVPSEFYLMEITLPTSLE